MLLFFVVKKHFWWLCSIGMKNSTWISNKNCVYLSFYCFHISLSLSLSNVMRKIHWLFTFRIDIHLTEYSWQIAKPHDQIISKFGNSITRRRRRGQCQKLSVTTQWENPSTKINLLEIPNSQWLIEDIIHISQSVFHSMHHTEWSRRWNRSKRIKFHSVAFRILCVNGSTVSESGFSYMLLTVSYRMGDDIHTYIHIVEILHVVLFLSVCVCMFFFSTPKTIAKDIVYCMLTTTTNSFIIRLILLQKPTYPRSA